MSQYYDGLASSETFGNLAWSYDALLQAGLGL